VTAGGAEGPARAVAEVVQGSGQVAPQCIEARGRV